MLKQDTSVLLSLLAQYWFPSLITIIIAWLVRNRYHNGLNKYPGPFLASITDGWRFWDVLGRRSEVTHQKLHAKYGDIVRLGPNMLSFADPNVMKTIYGLNKGFIKVSSTIKLSYMYSLLTVPGISPTSTLYSNRP
jgi:hypothetical protein